jgi:hypothetical protein
MHVQVPFNCLPQLTCPLSLYFEVAGQARCRPNGITGKCGDCCSSFVCMGSLPMYGLDQAAVTLAYAPTGCDRFYVREASWVVQPLSSASCGCTACSLMQNYCLHHPAPSCCLHCCCHKTLIIAGLVCQQALQRALPIMVIYWFF